MDTLHGLDITTALLRGDKGMEKSGVIHALDEKSTARVRDHEASANKAQNNELPKDGNITWIGHHGCAATWHRAFRCGGTPKKKESCSYRRNVCTDAMFGVSFSPCLASLSRHARRLCLRTHDLSVSARIASLSLRELPLSPSVHSDSISPAPFHILCAKKALAGLFVFLKNSF